MKRSHKLRSMGDVQRVVDAAPTLDDAARTLKINRSTLTRWLQAGKVKRAGQHPEPLPGPPAREVPVPPDGAAWADTVRATYRLTETDQKLVELAGRMLLLAEAPDTPAFTRIAAVGRYQQVVRQLALTDEKRLDAPTAVPSRPVYRPVAVGAGVDPRAILVAVK